MEYNFLQGYHSKDHYTKSFRCFVSIERLHVCVSCVEVKITGLRWRVSWIWLSPVIHRHASWLVSWSGDPLRATIGAARNGLLVGRQGHLGSFS